MQDSFRAIFKKYYPVTKRFALMLVKSEEDAEDIAQDVFASLWPKTEIWHNNAQIDRYICRMTRNICLNHIKHRAALSTAHHISLDDKLAHELTADAPTPADHLCLDELKLIIRMSVESMPPRRRQIFAMSRYEGMSHKEIADILGLSVRTVESHIFAALASLKHVIVTIAAIIASIVVI